MAKDRLQPDEVTDGWQPAYDTDRGPTHQRHKGRLIDLALDIRLHPDPVLRRRSEPVGKVDDPVRALAEQMVETLTKRGGYGLAAPQVGALLRLILVDVEEGFHVLANPEIVESSEENALGLEGCLSLPGIEAEVPRATHVTVVGFTMEGDRVSIEADHLLARVFQHEIDHLNGVLFIDHLGRAKRQRLIKEYQKALREGTAEERTHVHI